MTYLSDRLKRKNGELPPLPTKKDKKPISKISPKRKQELAGDKGDDALDVWFEERRVEMTGRCDLCGGKTEKKNDTTYRCSIHHLLEKSKFPSVAMHPENFLEVCFYGNSCHTNLHNKTITLDLLRDSAEWKIIVEKFKKIYPFIAENERRNIPELLLNELK